MLKKTILRTIILEDGKRQITSNEGGCGIEINEIGFFENSQGSNHQANAQGQWNCGATKISNEDEWGDDMDGNANELEMVFNQ